MGAIVKTPPPASQVVVINNSSYYVSEGVYYQQSSGGYTVVNPPSGRHRYRPAHGRHSVATERPDALQAGGVYYRPAMQNGVTVYTVVTL